MTPMIQAVRDWLLTCPHICDQLGEFGCLQINRLGPDPVEFSIEDVPAEPVVQYYLNGSRRIKNYVLTSRLEYSQEDAVQASASGLFDLLADWIEQQNRRRNFPRFEGCSVTDVSMSTSGYLVAVSEHSCRYQIQIAVEYFQPK